MRLSALVTALTCALAFVGSSEANTVPAIAGHGWPTHDDTCFGSSFQLMQNNCGGSPGTQRLLIIPVPTPWERYQTSFYDIVGALASGNGSNGMTNCQAISLSATMNSFTVSASAIVSTNTSNSRQWLDLGDISSPWQSTTHFECFVAQGGGQVHYVTFHHNY